MPKLDQLPEELQKLIMAFIYLGMAQVTLKECNALRDDDAYGSYIRSMDAIKESILEGQEEHWHATLLEMAAESADDQAGKIRAATRERGDAQD